MAKISRDIFEKIHRIEIQTNHLVKDLLAGAYRSAFRGKGIEFEDVRIYFPGDDVRSIDWNVTARMNHPYVKSFCEERELSVMLVVDVSASSRFGSSNRPKSDLIAEIAAVIAFSALRNYDRIGLILFSDRVETYIPPSKGVHHILRIVRELLTFKPMHRSTNLGLALAFLGKVQPRSGICFVISDFICEDYADEMALIARKHDLIAMSVTDPFELAPVSMGLMMMTDLETGEERLVDTSRPEYREKLKQATEERLERHHRLLKKLGAGSIDIQTDQPYMHPIRKFFKLRARRR